ncbi:MAG: four helix bundle protein [Kiritimatiellales bacterium]
MTYNEWQETVPEMIRQDSLWSLTVYRHSLFISDITWRDVKQLAEDVCTRSLSDQLYRSIGSVCANIEEGYSKISAKDRARFYEYALGSARESRGWFYRARHVLGEKVALHRINLLTEIIRLLLTMIPEQRTHTVCETDGEYVAVKWKNEKVPFYDT